MAQARKIWGCFLLSVIGLSGLYGQSVGIGTALPDPSARLHIEDAERGLLVPRFGLSEQNTPLSLPNPAIVLINDEAFPTESEQLWQQLKAPQVQLEQVSLLEQRIAEGKRYLPLSSK